MDSERRAFDRLLAAALTGRLSRRQVLARGAALGLSASALGVLSTAAAPSGKLGPAPTRAAATPKSGGTLKVGLQADPTALDPQKQSLTAIAHVVEHVYSQLVRIKPDLTVEPDLAESWTISPDGKTYTFKLRQGIKFHNGRPAVAADVKYSFERLVDPKTASPSASDLASMASIEAPSDQTVVINLKTADASLLTNLAGQSCYIIAKEVVEKNGDLSQVAVGTGPFVFKEYVPNTRIVLEKNKDYYESGKPYLDGMELIPISEETSRTTAVVTGTVDFIEYAPLRDVTDILQKDSSLTLAGDQNTNIRFLAFNLRKAPWNNPKVRQAVAAAIDRTAVIGPAVFGHGTPTIALFPKTYWAALDQPVTPPDVNKAKQLMKEAGFPDGFKTKLTSWAAYAFLSNAAQVVQEQLKKIGIDADLDLQETGTLFQNVYKAYNYDIAVTGDSAYTDPAGIILRNFHTGELSNFSGYSNPKVDKLIADGIATTDLGGRKEIYQEIQRTLIADLPWVNLFIANQFEAMKTYVKGYTHIPTGTNISLRETWLDK